MGGRAEGGFQFKLTPVDGAEMTSDVLAGTLIDDTVTVSANGATASWGAIEYVREGVRKYQISEVIPDGAEEVDVNGQKFMLYNGILYDPEPYDVEVDVNQGFSTWKKARTLYRGTSRQQVYTAGVDKRMPNEEYFWGTKADVTYYKNGEKSDAGALFQNKESPIAI